MDKINMFSVRVLNNGFILMVDGEDYADATKTDTHPRNEEYVTHELIGIHQLLDQYVFPNIIPSYVKVN